jgi:hypothetical protein
VNHSNDRENDREEAEMDRKLLVAAILVLSFFEVNSEAYAWDGKRKGFILGGALGYGVSPYTRKLDYNYGYGYSYSWSKSENPSAVMTDFKIGYAPTDLVEVYYMNKVSWFKADNDLTTCALTGIGLTYLFNPRAPSWFVSGGVGVSSWDFLTGGPNSLSGLGLVAGGGYEFSRYWSIEGNLLWGNPTRDEFGRNQRVNITTVRVTISFLQY